MSLDKITSIIAHIDHGKTTLIDSLIASTGFFSKSLAGELRYLDSRKDEQERGITLKLSPIKLANGHTFIDTPGHVDFESLIFSSSALGENHLILIDVNEGITPRTYSLVKFLDKNRCILVLNKIDKCDDVESINMIVVQINGLLKEEVFEWSKNNIILSSASLGVGISFRTFKLAKKNTISTAFKAFKLLEEKIESKDIESIISKYKIKFPNRKSVLNAVFPLAEAVFDTVNFIYESHNLIDSIDKLSINSKSEETSLDTSQDKNDKIESKSSTILENSFYHVSSEAVPDFLAITTHSILKKPGFYTKDNVLFLARVLKGKIFQGQSLFCCQDQNIKEVVVEEICDFEIEKYFEVDFYDRKGLILLKGDFLKNSAISSAPLNFKLKNFPTGFYTSKLVLKDLSQINKMKEMIKILGIIEQNLRCRMNKFSEFEFKCNGNVQFEKVCFDLKENGFDFVIKTAKKEFKEQSSHSVTSKFSSMDSERIIAIGPISEFDSFIKSKNLYFENLHYSEDKCIQDHIKNNIYYVESEENSHIIESVLGIFTDFGPLIKETITNTFFVVLATGKNDNNFFNILKNELTKLYFESIPSIYPMFINIKIYVTQKFSGVIYLCLQKFFYIIDNEDYDDDTGFVILMCKVPQFSFNELIDDIREKSKGSVYLEVINSEYIPGSDFSNLILKIREEKGLYNDEFIMKIISKGEED